MALFAMAYASWQQWAFTYVDGVKKQKGALNLGIISTANINALAIIYPALTHPDVNLYAVASRKLGPAQEYAKKYGIQKAYGSYDEMLADPVVDIVYNPLPNSMHYEWTVKALRAGKHVLLEKPYTSNGEEAEKLAAIASQSGKVLLEAFHWQFHPAAHAWREILDSGKYGKIISTKSTMTLSPGVPDGDIRFNYDFAGGSSMDATYTMSLTRYALRAGLPEEVLTATPRPYAKDARIDEAMYSSMIFHDSRNGSPVHSSMYNDLRRPWIGGVVMRAWELPSIEVETEKAIIYFYNSIMPYVFHYIQITEKATGKTTWVTKYSGGPCWGNRSTTGGKGGNWRWSTFRYQLEAFVDAVRGRKPACWVSEEDSIDQMKSLDLVYEKSGLGKRPSNDFASKH